MGVVTRIKFGNRAKEAEKLMKGQRQLPHWEVFEAKLKLTLTWEHYLEAENVLLLQLLLSSLNGWFTLQYF